MNKGNEQAVNLGSLFGQAFKAVVSHREEINALDRYNGNHGDNMVENLSLITRALQENRSLPPADALRYASQRLQSDGRGGTSQYYAQGLSQAAAQFQGRSNLEKGDVLSLVQTLMSAIPAEGHPQQPQQASANVLDVLGLLAGQQAQPQQQDDGLDIGDMLGLLAGQQAQPQQQDSGLDIGNVLGLLAGQQAQPQAQQPEGGVDVGGVLGALLPAGMAFLQAKQAGADTQTAVAQALMGALMGGRVNPFQANTPRAAAGGVVAQSLLQALIK
jgi:hypothetical protein